VSGENDGVAAQGDGFRLIVGDERYGTIDDAAAWVDLG
jgi:hypothetical protein